MKDLAKAIMYHHMDYDKLQKVDYAYKDLASYINIAEKMDIYSTSMGSQFDMYMFQKQAGNKLSSDGLYLFYQCAEKYSIFEKIASGEYKEELDEIVEYMIFSNEDKKEVLGNAYVLLRIQEQSHGGGQYHNGLRMRRTCRVNDAAEAGERDSLLWGVAS